MNNKKEFKGELVGYGDTSEENLICEEETFNWKEWIFWRAIKGNRIEYDEAETMGKIHNQYLNKIEIKEVIETLINSNNPISDKVTAELVKYEEAS